MPSTNPPTSSSSTRPVPAARGLGSSKPASSDVVEYYNDLPGKRPPTHEAGNSAPGQQRSKKGEENEESFKRDIALLIL